MYLTGVNLGGWLVPEKWIVPSLFKAYSADSEPDLYSKSVEDPETLNTHYATFITEQDFKFLKDNGVNAIRLPVSYGVFGVFSGIPKTIQYVDFAFEMAKKYELQVLVDLHSAPGGQNGWEKGKQGAFNWHKDATAISSTVKVIENLAKHLKNHPNLYGIELLNEPHMDIPFRILHDFYKSGYEAVRKHCDSNVAVVIHDSFRPKFWEDFMLEPEFTNVVLDMHLYQCFSVGDKKMTILEHLHKTNVEWLNLINSVQKGRKAICGEWSLALDDLSFVGLNSNEKSWAIRDFGKAQLEVFKNLAGNFFWTYKMPYATSWNFKSCAEKGILSYS